MCSKTGGEKHGCYFPKSLIKYSIKTQEETSLNDRGLVKISHCFESLGSLFPLHSFPLQLGCSQKDIMFVESSDPCVVLDFCEQLNNTFRDLRIFLLDEAFCPHKDITQVCQTCSFTVNQVEGSITLNDAEECLGCWCREASISTSIVFQVN